MLDVVKTNLVVSTPEITLLVEKFNTFARKTAEGVLEMAKAVWEANKLKSSEFHRFCELVGINGSSATTKKFITIGDKYEYLIGRSEKLPPNWTTVYEVAKLTEEQIESLIDTGVLNSSLIADDLNIALGKVKKIKSKKVAAPVLNGTDDGIGFRAKLISAPDKETAEKIKDLLEELKKLKVQIEISTTLKAFFQTK